MRGWYTQIAELKEENEKLRAEVKQLRAEITAWDELEGIKFLREEQARLKDMVERQNKLVSVLSAAVEATFDWIHYEAGQTIDVAMSHRLRRTFFKLVYEAKDALKEAALGEK